MDELKEFPNGTILLSFDGECFLNGVKLPKNLGAAGSCSALAHDFDAWLAETAWFIMWESLEDSPDAAARLLKMYCRARTDYWSSRSYCGKELEDQVRSAKLPTPVDLGGGPAIVGRVRLGGPAVGLWLSSTTAARNRALYERYLTVLRASMAKPHVANSELAGIMDQLWRANARVGNGSTAAAVRFEKITGKPVGGVWHSQKAQDKINELTKWIRRQRELSADLRASPSDYRAAEDVLRDLLDAVEGR